MRAFLNVFREHRKLYITLLAVGAGTVIFGTFVPLIIALLIVGTSIIGSVRAGGGITNKGSEKPLERYSRKELIARLQDADEKAAADTKEISRLQEEVTTLSQIDADTELMSKVLQLVAGQLTAYDKFKGKVTAEDTIEFLRGTLILLGEGFQAEQTEHFTKRDWEESLQYRQDFARARKRYDR